MRNIRLLSYYHSINVLTNKFSSRRILPNMDWLKFIEIRLFLESKEQNEEVFTSLIIMLEKQYGSRVDFIIDVKTLSRKKKIKVGCKLIVKDSNLLQIFAMNFTHNFTKSDKYHKKELFFHTMKGKEIDISLKKALFNSVFLYDIDSDGFYNLFDEAVYKVEFRYLSNFDTAACNRIIVDMYDFNQLLEKEDPISSISQKNKTFSDEIYGW